MSSLSRREFIAASAAGAAAVAAGNGFGAQENPSPKTAFKTRLYKSVISGIPNEKSLATLKEAGFDGIECRSAGAEPAKAEAARGIAEKLDMRIHSVLRGWLAFDKPSQVACRQRREMPRNGGGIRCGCPARGSLQDRRQDAAAVGVRH